MYKTQDIVAAVRSVVGPGLVAFCEASIGVAEQESMAACVRAGAVGYQYVDQFQDKIAQVCGTEQATAVSSGTAAIHMALLAAGVVTGDEVLMPALTFVGTANAACYLGAIPHFVDSRDYDLGIHPFKLQRYLASILATENGKTVNKKTGRRIGAILVVHLLGHPSALAEIVPIAAHYQIPLIEDAAEALGSIYRGKPCGSFGTAAAVSFNNNKIVTTNGGGAVLTNDAWVQARAWTMATTARIPHAWLMEHSELAWNYRMGNVNAALGLPQLERLDALVEAKRRLAARYATAFSGIGVDPFIEREGCRSNHWLSAIMLNGHPNAPTRDEVLGAMTDEGIACRALFTPMHELPFYSKNPRANLEGAMDAWRRTICLPSSAKLGEV